MELFVVKNRKSLEVLRGFNNKMEAKVLRKATNPKDDAGKEIMDFVISVGRHHDRAKTRGHRHE